MGRRPSNLDHASPSKTSVYGRVAHISCSWKCGAVPRDGPSCLSMHTYEEIGGWPSQLWGLGALPDLQVPARQVPRVPDGLGWCPRVGSVATLGSRRAHASRVPIVRLALFAWMSSTRASRRRFKSPIRMRAHLVLLQQAGTHSCTAPVVIGEFERHGNTEGKMWTGALMIRCTSSLGSGRTLGCPSWGSHPKMTEPAL